MFMYYLKEALSSLNRSKFSSFIITVSLCISITLITVSIFLILISGRIEDKLMSKIEINVFLNDSLTSAQTSVLKSKLTNLDHVGSVIFIDREEAAKIFEKETGEQFNHVLLSNPLPNSFKIGFNPSINKEKINNVVTQIRSLNGVDEIIYDYNQLLTILNIVNSGKFMIYILSILFTMISLFLIYSNNKFYLNSRAVHFNTMKLVGAKLSLIRMPMIIRGLLLGFIASIACAIIGNVVIMTIKELFAEFRYIDNFYYFNFIIFALGLLLGGLGSGLFVKKVTLSIDFKKKKFE